MDRLLCKMAALQQQEREVTVESKTSKNHFQYDQRQKEASSLKTVRIGEVGVISSTVNGPNVTCHLLPHAGFLSVVSLLSVVFLSHSHRFPLLLLWLL